MGDFRIVINAIGGHGQDRSKKNGEIVDFTDGGNVTPESMASEFVKKLIAEGVNVQDAYVVHWPIDNYGGQINNGRSQQITDDLITGKRIGEF